MQVAQYHNSHEMSAHAAGATSLPQLRIAAEAYCRILAELVSRPAEAGGLLLGPVDSDDITEFFFDIGGICTGATYSPDHVTLNRHLKESWLPSGRDWKGFVHSHPRGYGRLSSGDLAYIGRLLAKSSDMTTFAAPIVLPDEFRFCPFIVRADRPRDPIHAQLVLF